MKTLKDYKLNLLMNALKQYPVSEELRETVAERLLYTLDYHGDRLYFDMDQRGLHARLYREVRGEEVKIATEIMWEVIEKAVIDVVSIEVGRMFDKMHAYEKEMQHASK